MTIIAGGRPDARLTRAFQNELRLAGVTTEPVSSPIVCASELAVLPEPVRRYLSFMGVAGRPRDTSIQTHVYGKFRRGGGWLPCEVRQYDSRSPIVRVFVMHLSLAGVLPVTVRDLYARGKGFMSAKAFDKISVASAFGYELDVGELVTYVNDAILMAPSLLLGPETSWIGVGADAFDVALTDGPQTVTARVWLDERGAPRDFSTRDRFFERPDGSRMRTEWRTPIDGWQMAQGRPLPTRGYAVWHLPEGPFPYADFTFDPERTSFNAPPG